jgi:hypothetical protein
MKYLFVKNVTLLKRKKLLSMENMPMFLSVVFVTHKIMNENPLMPPANILKN